jgi:hypothetical protein
MFSQRVFNLVSHLIFSRWARGYEEHHGSCEDAYAAHIGPLHLEINRCFVLDHDDAYIGIQVPMLHRSGGRWQRGRLYLGYRVCLGEEPVRETGFCTFWSRPLPKVVYGQACLPDGDEYFPF